jgi:NAD(P)-dependent dehydrogenase (short-subunit alcohol dehydrogenase family)
MFEAQLAGKAAIVTGAERGIGKEIAMELARRGCRIGVNYPAAPDVAEETASEIRGLGVDAFAVQADVGVGSEVRRMVAEVVARFGQLDILVNNAGVQTVRPLLEVTEDEWDFVIRTNLTGSFLCTQAAALHMKEHGGGVIVNIGSGSNKAPFPGLIAYTASRGGIEMLTKVSAVELGPHGIRVNCIAPGAIETARTRLELPDYAGAWSRTTPLGRIGTPGDVAGAIAFIVSDDAAFITGQTIMVDGGLFTQGPWPRS